MVDILAELQLMRGNTKGLFFLSFFRVSSYLSKTRLRRLIGFPVRIMYKLLVQWMMGIDIPDQTKIGFGFKLFHGQGVVVHEDVVIGDSVRMRHNTTIGVAHDGGACPVIGSRVDIGANAVIIGRVIVGDDSIIAAGSVVIRDVPNRTVVAGNPAKVVKHL